MIFLYALGAVLAIAGGRRTAAGSTLAHGSAAAGAAAGLVAAAAVLAGGGAADLSMGSPVPFAPWRLHCDTLSAFLLLLISLAALAASVYAVGYAREFAGRAGFPFLGALHNLFILSLALVVTASNAFMFLVAWEAMALFSFLLVVHRHEDPQVRRAGYLYAVMTHVGTACIIAAFLLLFAHTGSLDFAAWREAAGSLSGPARTAAFLLALAGFGAKAGVIPLHIWLPAAHPAAPSHISALMSGVMLKTAVYGLLRTVFLSLGRPEPWWGLAILGLGAVTALLGVIYALMEQDMKRLLAYSSVENIGIVFLGLGTALLFQSYGFSPLAALALAAALLHALNHAAFKGLLFLAAGAVVQAMHTADIERMGGLIRGMPRTAFFFLAGSLAIAGLPPLNGFVSEWLSFQSLLLLGMRAPEPVVQVLAPVAGAALALTGALAAACFVRAFGIAFLALPRSEAAGRVREAPAPLLAGMGILAAACLFIGILPGVAMRLLDPVALQVAGAGIASAAGGTAQWGWGSLAVVEPDVLAGGLSPLALFLLLAGLGVLALAAARVVPAGRAPARVEETWACGIGLQPRMEYTAAAFAKPIRIIFRQLLRPRREIEADYEVSPYFACSLRYRAEIPPLFEQYLYRPLWAVLLRIAQRVRGIQAGSIQAYLAYILITLVLLLLVAV